MKEANLGFQPSSQEFDLGMPGYMAEKARRLILDESIEIAPSGRTAHQSRKEWGEWTREDITKYAIWLAHLLEINPAESGSSIRQEHIVRASKLNIGPSTQVIDSVLGNYGTRELNLLIGNKTPQYLYRDLSKKECVQKGVRLADRIGKRPTGDYMDELAREGEFVGRNYIVQHFGSLGNYFELIGRPHPRGWQKEDYLDWINAYFEQNGPDMRLTVARLETLAARGTGPARVAFSSQREHWVNVKAFDQDGREEFWRRQEEKEMERQEQLAIIKEKRLYEKPFEEATNDLEGDELLIYGCQYRLAQRMLPDGTPPHTLNHVAQLSNPEFVVKYLMKNGKIENGKRIGRHHIEAEASMMGIFGALWPMYRFQNVDLRIAA